MNIAESLSTFPEVFNEHYSISHARHVFSRMRDRCPKEYEEKKITIRQAAELLNVDHRTLHQRIGMLKPKKVICDGHPVKYLVSIRDLADMLIDKPLKGCAHKTSKRYTKEELNELKTTGKIKGRTYNAYKTKAFRLGLKLKDLRPSNKTG